MISHASGGQALDDGAHFGGWIVQQGRRIRLQRVGKRSGRPRQLSGLNDRRSSRRSGSCTDSGESWFLAYSLCVEADEKGPKPLHVLEAVGYAWRNVKDISWLQRSFDAATNRASGLVIDVRPFLGTYELAAGYRYCRACCHYPNISRFSMNQRGIALFHDSDVDAVASAFQDPLIDDLSGLQIFPNGLQVFVSKVGGFLRWRRWRLLDGRTPALAPLTACYSSPHAKQRDGAYDSEQNYANFSPFHRRAEIEHARATLESHPNPQGGAPQERGSHGAVGGADTLDVGPFLFWRR